MSADTQDNAQSSTATSSSGPPVDTTLSEREYLEREAARTEAALADTLGDLKQSLVEGVDPREWAKRFPWTTLGVAAAAGFAAAVGIMKGRGSKASSNGSVSSANGAAHSPEPVPVKFTENSGKSTRAAITSGLFELAKVAIEASITAASRAAATDREPPPPPPESPTSPASPTI